MSADDIIRCLNAASEKAKELETENIALKVEIKRLNEKCANILSQTEMSTARLTRERNRMAGLVERAGLLSS